MLPIGTSKGERGMTTLLPEFITLLAMAFAVSMDAFSIALGMGMFKLRMKQIFYIGLTIGVFHVLMPLFGIFAGHLLSGTFGKISNYVGGALLLVLGLQMSIFCFSKNENSLVAPVGWGIVLFGGIVSIDSFSAGLSLGIFGVKAFAAVMIFGAVAVLLTWSGLILGRKVQGYLGAYGELLGGIFLIAFGVKLLMPF